MTLFLFVTAIIGLVIFFFSYLRIVYSSFRHHTVTGLISIFPGINLAVLPTVWGKMSGTFILSIVGLGISLAAWYGGGNQHLLMHSMNNGNVTGLSAQLPVNASVADNNRMASIHKTKEVALPQKPLYYIIFKKAELSELNSLVNHHIRVKLTDDRLLEGKNLQNTNNMLLLETYNKGTIKLVKIPAKHIRSLEKLVTTKE